MRQRSFLADIMTTLFERRSNRAEPEDGAADLEALCLRLLDAEGEVSGLRLAREILEGYATCDATGKLAFFEFLNEGLEIDAAQLKDAAAAYASTGAIEDYRAATAAAEPRRQELLRRLNQPPGATAALVQMRADLLRLLPDHPALRRTDMDFQHLLRSWFNRGFLVLSQINWATPASILEKIVAYEAVHAINDWDDLRRRVEPMDRRCFAYFHPAMPDEPLIFVEVALTRDIPSSIQHLLTTERVERPPSDAKVAVFYSISNCQAGLAGISFGNLLIKQVVDELRRGMPGLETFVTLSPIPGFNAWLKSTGDAERILQGDGTPDQIAAEATRYLLEAKTPAGLPLDPVARFHLGNGAQIHAVHGAADLSEKGLADSSGAMVNYLYDLTKIEANHEGFVQERRIATSPGVTLVRRAQSSAA